MRKHIWSFCIFIHCCGLLSKIQCNKRPEGALFPPAFVQICLPYVLCRLSPFAIALQTSLYTKSLLRFWFRTCLRADNPQGVLNMVGHNYWYATVGFYLFSECSSISVATFIRRFYVLWHHDCVLTVREQAKSKAWSKDQLLSMPVGIKSIISN